MIHKHYRITCDACNKVEHNEGAETELEALELAKADGWTFGEVANGAEWDFCPDCTKEKES